MDPAMRTQSTTAPGSNRLSDRSNQDVVNNVLTQASVLSEISDVEARAGDDHRDVQEVGATVD